MCMAMDSGGQAAMVAATGGLGLSLLPFVWQANSTRAAAQYQSDVADANAKVAQYQAKDAARRGEIEVDRINRAASRTAGAGRAGYAAAGIALGSGSPVSWEESVAANAALDVEMTQYNTELARWGFGVQRQNYLSESGYAKWAGRQKIAADGISVLKQAGTTALLFV